MEVTPNSDGIESAALAAFGSRINFDAPGLVEVVQSMSRHAEVDPTKKEIVLNVYAFMVSMISVGMRETPSPQNAATWFAAWLKEVPTPLSPGWVFPSGFSDSIDKILGAFGEGYQFVVSRTMLGVLERAAGYARQTVDRAVPDLRHVAAALLADDGPGWGAFASLGWSPTADERTDFCSKFLKRIAENPETNEGMEAWQKILLPNGGRGRSRARSGGMAGFVSDTPSAVADGDPLGIDADVQAFARLICYEPATLPLSIGLFGGWGSGKSTFMQRLEAAIDAICTLEAERRSTPGAANADTGNQTQPRFISKVVQIRFNAWQFADANLWASLTAEFFDQLRSGGYLRRGTQLHARLVERVTTHVHSLTESLNVTRKTLATSEQELVKAQQARDTAVHKAESDQQQLVSQTLIDSVGKAYEKHKADLVALGATSASQSPATDIAAFVELAKQVRTIRGQLAVLLRFTFAKGQRVAAVLLGVGLIVFSFGWLEASFLQSIAGYLAGLAALAVPLAPAIRIVGGVLSSTAKFAGNLEELSSGGAKDILAREAELEVAVQEAQARRQSVQRATQALARYIDPRGAANPPRLLRYVLEDDPDTKALEKEIGITSRARRLFEAVDQIVKQERGRPAAQAPDVEVPDRIILYIDDLDRCTHAQVYAVLQAIHLLLAFELFVVVVAVDVEWIRQSLEVQIDGSRRGFDDDAPNGPRSGVGDDARKSDLQSQKRAVEYLEKIFQFPFWLRPFNPNGSETDNYGKYIRNLTEPKPARADAPKPGSAARSAAGPAATANPAVVPAGSVSSGATAASSRKIHEAELDEGLSAIQLTKAEIEFLASPEIGRIAAKQPRSVKRLVNVYRIVRARMSASEIDELLGQSGPPDYPIVIFLLALETGQSLEVVELFYDELNAKKPGEKMHISRDDAVHATLSHVTNVRGQPVSAEKYLKIASDLRRFSFNPYK